MEHSIKFCPSSRKNESLLLFSSSLTPDAMAAKIRSIDIIKDAALILRDELMNTKFDLDDKFCDAQDLRDSWINGIIKPNTEYFLATLLKLNRISISKHKAGIDTSAIENFMIDSDDECGEEFDGGIDDIGNTVKSNISAYSLFQIMVYNINNGKIKTPLHVMTGHAVYAKCRCRGLITSLNKIGSSISYKEVRKYRSLLASYTVKKGKDGHTPIPSHFETTLGSGMVSGAFDNMNLKDRSSISGMNITDHCALVLYQDATCLVTRKPVMQEGQKGHFYNCLTESLACQKINPWFKCKERPCLEADMKISLPKADETELNLQMKRQFIINTSHCAFTEHNNIII